MEKVVIIIIGAALSVFLSSALFVGPVPQKLGY